MKKRVISILLSLCLFAGFVPSMQLDLNTEAKTEAMTEDVAAQYLSDLEWSSQSCGASQDFPGGTVKDALINGGAMVLLVEGKETSFNKGLGAHAPSEIVYDISDMGCTKFEAYAGVDYQCFRDYQNGEAIVGNFIVEIDGVQVAQSGEMNPAMDAYHFVVDVPEGGPTFDPVTVNALTLQVVEGEICFYLEDVLVAKSASLGKMSVNGSVVSDFVIAVHEVQENVTTERGCATRLVLEMSSTKANLTKTVWYDLLTDIEGAVVTTTFVTSAADIKLTEIVENEFALADPDPTKIWSYNGGGEGSQSFYDTLQKVNNSFSRENKQDETAAAIPAADIYSVNGGITVGDASLYRRFLSTPVKGGKNTATVSVKWQEAVVKANEMAEVGTSIIGVHTGDYYSGLRIYANVMEAQGFSVPEYVPESSYDLRWESWGREGAWTIEKILGKLDELYAYGIDAYETYVIEKDGMMYYSFYRDGAKYRPTGNPEVVLKGLEPDTAYKVEDYVNGTVIAENVLGSEAVFEQSFSNYLLLRAIPIEKEEVYQGQWYTDAICWAYETGVAKGSSPTRFGVDDLITRQQLATMLFNYAKYKGYDSQTRGHYSALKGADEVADYAVETMKWAVGKGFINGSKTTIAGTTVYDLNPAGTATRAQMASVLMKFCEENHL